MIFTKEYSIGKVTFVLGINHDILNDHSPNGEDGILLFGIKDEKVIVPTQNKFISYAIVNPKWDEELMSKFVDNIFLNR